MPEGDARGAVPPVATATGNARALRKEPVTMILQRILFAIALVAFAAPLGGTAFAKPTPKPTQKAMTMSSKAKHKCPHGGKYPKCAVGAAAPSHL